MPESRTPFCVLIEDVLGSLKEQHYMDSTLTVYRRLYNRVHSLMKENDTEIYTKEIGQAFLKNVDVCCSAFREYSCAIRRLDDFIDGKPYRSHHGMDITEVTELYVDILNSYLDDRREYGNKPTTIRGKARACTAFLNYIAQEGCTDISNLDADLTSAALLTYSNKDNYAIIRHFLTFLAEEGFTKRDFSGLVPHYKRGKKLPTTYSPAEILKLEAVIDTSTDTGKRDMAIIRLATRMGLRSGDIARLKWSEVDFNAGTINIIQEKTGIPLSLLMPTDVSDTLIAFSNSKKSELKDEYVFHIMVAPYGRLTTNVIRHVVNNCFVASGIDTTGKKHGPHAFRSSLASSMVNDDASYETVRRILGHSDPDMITHYARTDIEKLRLCSIDPPPPSGRFGDYLSGRRNRHV